LLEITLEDVKLAFRAILHNWLLIGLITGFGFFGGLFVTGGMSENNSYEATSSVCVTYSSYEDQISGGNVMVNYSDIVMSNRVCEYAANIVNSHADGQYTTTAADIQGMVSMALKSNSYVMTIRAASPSPATAISVVNAVAESFVAQVSTIAGTQAIQVLDTADSARIISDDSLNRLRLGAVAGAFVFACLVVVVASLFSGKVRSIAQCVEVGGGSDRDILTIIPNVKDM
jgi:capsular polysaccharide biosynthesis protein